MGNLSGESREQIRKDKVTRFRSVTYARQLGLLVNTLGRHLKISEFAFFQLYAHYSNFIYFVKCKRTLFEQNSYQPYSSSERERKFRRRLFTSSIKREIRNFHAV